jgi:DNA-binding LacI/PurR family transcriptional regulator
MINNQLNLINESTRKGTLVAKVEGTIREMIRNGNRYLPGNRLAPLRELAEEFGVSHSTVDEALQNLVRQGWLEQRAGKGVRVVNELPHRVVAFVSEEESRSWGSSLAEQLIMQGINEILSDAGYQTKIYGLYDPHDEKPLIKKPFLNDAIERARDGMLSGMILRGNPENVARFAQQAKEIKNVPNLPFVRVQSNSFGNEAHVHIDLKSMVSMHIKYLREVGCRNIAFCSGSTRSTREHVDFQVSVFKEELLNAGLKFDPRNIIQIVIEDDAEAKYGYGIFEHISYGLFSRYWSQAKADGNLPDGLAVTDDIVARSLSLALLRDNVKVPQDLKVITSTNKGSGVYFPFPFMQCEINISELGKEASRLILNQLGGDEEAWHAKSLIKPTLLPPHEWKLSF